jgi:cob(I)alamin adenosyltransferase
MVTLSKIYTKTGDSGKTRLGDMTQVDKTDDRIEAYGTVDELNSVLGLAVQAMGDSMHQELLRRVQNDLFDLGADLCFPQQENEKTGDKLRVNGQQVQRLEVAIDQINKPLEPLRSFVLPGGSQAAAWLHLGRTVCRRAERQIWRLATKAEINPQVLLYLNRLSDLLFVMSRAANQQGEGDVLWKPGMNQEE